MKKQTKKTTKRTAPTKTAAIKRQVVKKSRSAVVTKKVSAKSKRPVPKSKKQISKRRKNTLKPIGIFIAFAGIIGLVSFLSFAIAGLLAPPDSTDTPVLGATTGMMAPVEFKAMVVDYSVMLSWSNSTDGDYQYVIWVYDSDVKKYHPEAIVNGNGSIGEVITKTYDQEPGSTLLYKISMCEDCKLTSDRTITGTPGDMSPGIVVKVPRIPAPSSLKISNNVDGIKLTWSQLQGVDGFYIWRKTSFFGSYKKIGSVGINGTYSSYHAYDSDGVAKVPIDVPSPTVFIDSNVVPGRRYYYTITAKKMIVPIVGKKAWSNIESNSSRQVAIVTAKLITPKKFTVQPASTDRVLVYAEDAETTPISGYYLYCDKCSTKRNKLLSSDSSEIKFGGVDSEKKLIAFSLNGLSEDTKYGLRLSRYRIVGSRVYESAKTKVAYLTTNDVQSPPTPIGFSYNETIEKSKASFAWEIPKDEVYEYSMSIDCVKGSSYPLSVWKGMPIPYKNDVNDISVSENYNFDIKDFGDSQGSCTAYLTAYDSGSGLYSEPAVATFEN